MPSSRRAPRRRLAREDKALAVADKVRGPKVSHADVIAIGRRIG
jgi:hypothetical protein